ncbi:MAG: insulinase family protein [Alphaproteobacteria bacterium]|jgi:zinc protease|nr:insulinase family protein [Alphaproteobacteria bacterium]
MSRLVGVLASLVIGVWLLLPASGHATDVERIVTPAGINVWYVREPSIPIIALSLGFRGGSALDPAGKEGLSNLAMSLLDEGAGDMDDLAFQEAIVDRAIQLGFRAGLDMLSVSLRTLSQNRDDAFSLLGLALRAPRFDGPAVARVKDQIQSVLASDEKDPNSIVSRSWFEAMFGTHPYSRPRNGTPDGVRAIGSYDLHNLVRTRLTRGNVIVGASGDVPAAEMARLVDLALADLPAEASPVIVPEVVFPTQGQLIVREMEIPQSIASFGLPGLKRHDPDFYAAYVMNYILGGSGFSSRLTESVREKRGLAYSVYSYLYPLQHAGLFVGGVATRNDAISESLELIRAELTRMAEEGVSERELANAKLGMTGAFPLRFDSAGAVADMLVGMQYEDLGIDYIDRRNSYIEAVTTTDVRLAARRLLDVDQLLVVIVGSPEGLADDD